MRFAFKKEIMYFSRTFRLFGVIFSIMIFALADPFIMKSAQAMLNWMGGVVESQGIEGAEDSLGAFSLLDGMNAEDVVRSSVADFSTTASLIVLLILMQPSGGEQKKRSVIIPQCAGLTPTDYVVPKFIIYPAVAFVTALVSLPLCAGICTLMFDGAASFTNALASGALVGVYIAFLITVELTIGICFVKPALAAVITLLAGNLMPTIFALFRVDRFNPFALPVIAAEAAAGTANTLNALVSTGVSITLSLILFFATLFTLTVKKIENEGSDPLL